MTVLKSSICNNGQKRSNMLVKRSNLNTSKRPKTQQNGYKIKKTLKYLERKGNDMIMGQSRVKNAIFPAIKLMK